MSATTATTSPVPMTVARYLELQISRSDKKQSQMAKELGFDHPNIITMLKQGKTKVPYRRIGLIAKVLDADPAYLLRLVVSEKEPELLEVIEDAMDRDIYTASEKKLISIIRDGLRSRGSPADRSPGGSTQGTREFVDSVCRGMIRQVDQ